MRPAFRFTLKVVNSALQPVFWLLHGSKKARGKEPSNFPFSSKGDLQTTFNDGGANYVVGLRSRGLSFVTYAPRLAKLLGIEPPLEVFPTAEGQSSTRPYTRGAQLPANSFMALKSNGEIDVGLTGTGARVGVLTHPGKVHFLASKQSDLSLRPTGRVSSLHVSEPVPILDTNNAHNIFFVFVDGLSWEFFDDKEIASTMPNAGMFFKTRGYVSQKFYSVSNWTLPSFASIFTGLRPNEHGLWHPRQMGPLDSSIRTLSQLAACQGLLTSQFNGNHRITPTYGYARGFQRIAWERWAGAETLTSELMDWVSALQERRHFSFLSLFDIHRPWPGGIPTPGLSITSDVSYLSTLEKPRTKSVFSFANRDLAITYREVVRRIDDTFGRLIDFCDGLDRPSKIVLVSDHGQSYFREQDSPLDNQRIHVPFAVGSTGGKLDVGPDLLGGGILQSDDVIDVVARMLGIQVNKREHFRRNGELFIAENIFPGQPYLMRVGDSRNWVEFESNESLDEFHPFSTLSVDQAKVSSGCSREFENVARQEMVRRLDSLQKT